MDELTPRYVLSLPLHVVTEVYGEQGLRRRFQLEIASFPEPERAVLERAFRLAERLHRDDRRSREPVLNHLLRVTIRIMCHYRVRDVDVLAAALLHDTVEDHPEELAGGAPEDPTAAALAVLARDKDEQYREHVAANLAEMPWARPIKVSDFTDNGVGILYTIGPKVRRAAVKYGPLVPVLRELVARPDTPLTDEVKERIAGQFDLAEQRFAAILAPG
jgi:hypothetical protein